MKTRAKIALGIAGGVVVAGAATAAVMAHDREIISWAASALAGESVTVGSVDRFAPGLTTTIALSDLEAGDAARLDRFEGQLDLRSIWSDAPLVRSIALSEGRLALLRDENGWSWPLESDGSAPEQGVEVPAIGALSVTGIEISVDDRVDDRSHAIRIVTLDGGAPDLAAATIAMEASLDGRALTASVEPARLDGENALAVAVAHGQTDAEVTIPVAVLSSPAALRGRVRLAGADFGEAFDLLGFAHVGTPPYAITSDIRRDGAIWRFDNLDGRLGDSDIAGRLDVDFTGDRAAISGALQSGRLDFDDLGPLVGLPPSQAEGEAASADQRALAAERAAENRVFPTATLEVEKIRDFDADLRYRADEILLPGLNASGFILDLRLNAGRLRLPEIAMTLENGRVRAVADVDARARPVDSFVSFAMDEVRTQDLAPETLGRTPITGPLFLRGHLRGKGDSVAAFMGDSRGALRVWMPEGDASALILELGGLDLGEGLGAFINAARVPVRCMIADMHVVGGTARSQALFLDTTDSVVSGEMTVDLGAEVISGVLGAKPKDISLFSLRSPIRIDGPLRAPDVAPEAGPIVLQLVAAAGLGAAFPPAAILPFIETGGADDRACEQSLTDIFGSSARFGNNEEQARIDPR